MLGSVPVMGIWDDHDYGHNDAGWDLPVKNLTRKAFLDFIEEGQVCGVTITTIVRITDSACAVIWPDVLW